MRKICSSCNEEIALGNAATDDNGLGYCDATVYGYNATVSGLLVVPLDETGQNYLPGPMTVSAPRPLQFIFVCVAYVLDTPCIILY